MGEHAGDVGKGGDRETKSAESGHRTGQGECVSVQRRWGCFGCLVSEVLGKPEVGFCLCHGGRLACLAAGISFFFFCNEMIVSSICEQKDTQPLKMRRAR